MFAKQKKLLELDRLSMNKYIITVSLVTTILLNTGCSTKSISKSGSSYNKVEKENQSEEDDFLDEFEEEMELEEVYDPFKSYNIAMTSFNDGLYEYILAPTAKGYRIVVHKEIRNSVDNFFDNILYPIRLVNNLLQGKFQNASEETGRFIVNSTVGVLGLFDPAKSELGWEEHDEDFGQTLGFYGVSAGPHIVLPFFGPSNLRDALSLYTDSYLSPVNYKEDRDYNLVDNYMHSLILEGYEKVNYVSLHEGQYEKLKDDAIELYPYLKDVYEQYRIKQIEE